MRALNGMAVLLAIGILLPLIAGSAAAADNGTANGTAKDDDLAKGQNLAAIGAAIAIGLAGMGSAIGLALAGSAAAGSTAEKPDNFKNNLVLQSLPMTQVVYALVISIFIALGMGFIGGGNEEVQNENGGAAAIAVGLVVGLTGLSAIPQGMVATSSIAATSRNSEVMKSTLIFTTMPETTAIFGFVIAILLVLGFGFLG